MVTPGIKHGVDAEAAIREVYQKGEDKIVFWKKLQPKSQL